MSKLLQFLVSPTLANQATIARSRQHAPDSKPSSWILVLAAIVLVTSMGCGDPNRSKIVGTWNIDSPNAIERVRQEPDVADDNSANEEPATQRPKMIVHFYRSGALETETDMGRTVSKKSGTWRMVSFDEEGKKVTIECDLTNQTTQHDILLVDENTIRMVPPNMAGLKKKLKFVRD